MQKVAKFTDISIKFPEVTTFLFDMDGTVMFTERLHAMAINQILKENDGNEFELDVLENICLGLNDEVIYKKLQKDHLLTELSLEDFLNFKTQVFSEMLKSVEPSDIFNPDVLTLLKEIKASKSKMALVTSSERETTHQLLEFLNIKSLFDVIITREDTEQNKPYPAPYLYAFDQLGTNANNCLIFEDSIVGLKAAKASLANVFEVRWYDHSAHS